MAKQVRGYEGTLLEAIEAGVVPRPERFRYKKSGLLGGQRKDKGLRAAVGIPQVPLQMVKKRSCGARSCARSMRKTQEKQVEEVATVRRRKSC